MSREKSITEAFSFKIDSLTRKMRRYAFTQLKQQGIDITVDQWGALGLLYEQEKPISQRELAERLIKDAPTTSRILDILHKKRYLERKPVENDRRKFNLILTKEGKHIVESIKPIVSQIRENIFEGMSEKDFEQLDRLISKILKNVE